MVRQPNQSYQLLCCHLTATPRLFCSHFTATPQLPLAPLNFSSGSMGRVIDMIESYGRRLRSRAFIAHSSKSHFFIKPRKTLTLVVLFTSGLPSVPRPKTQFVAKPRKTLTLVNPDTQEAVDLEKARKVRCPTGVKTLNLDVQQ